MVDLLHVKFLTESLAHCPGQQPGKDYCVVSEALIQQWSASGCRCICPAAGIAVDIWPVLRWHGWSV